ncbi:glycoside hydrolase family 76 protein [Nocardia sp. CDC159]|uniref:Glycoside hydrolase family 76 protein n=1 Tax=Nocardia pulmonis TaxID=2951408 RepID=A0A9X2E664_9NOCA|nr:MULTISPECIES: glycoside hydrolase family 76 protein [Nocardia]MCM6774529.1 glycoside hydrolase family 76 protein [Nocardia pulmonis]MCM6787405.1 glycoside hydrolase family 76 protein [Nocardia sp. CDC159]
MITLTTAGAVAGAAIDNGQPGDMVWLDRRAEDDDPRQEQLGVVAVAAAGTSASTQSYQFAGGVLRACGKAGDRQEIRCTRWIGQHDAAADRRLRAVERLLDRYDTATGLWENDASTWQSANALTALIDYMARTDDRQYVGYIDKTYRHGTVAQTGVPRNTGYNDDELWWALAWIDAFDLTSEQRYLDAARTIVDSLDDQRAAFCDGGLAWARMGIDPQRRPWTQVNSITNALYLTAAALLSTRVEPTSRPAYLARAQQTQQWFTQRAGRALLDRSGLINDHLDQYGDTCVLVDSGTRWTYTQGAMVGGLVALYRATGNEELLRAADRIVIASTDAASPFLRDGVLWEYAATDCPGPGCHDAETFKGVFVRSYRELADTGRSRAATSDFLTHQANSLTSDDDDYGFRWHAPMQADDYPNFATQAAAIDALNAACG